MKYDKKILQNNIRYIRKKSGLSQADFAEEINLSQHMISVYETDSRLNPKLDVLIKLSEHSKTPIEALLTMNLKEKENVFNHGIRKPNTEEYVYSYFKGMTYYVYYLTESVTDPFYKGFISMDDEYDSEHYFLHGTASTGHIYDCKMVIEGTEIFHIYGTEINLPRRFHLQMHYPDFREENKYQAGLGILSRINSRKQIVGMRLAVSSKELNIKDLRIRDELKYFLTTGEYAGKIAVSHELDDEFREWVNDL